MEKLKLTTVVFGQSKSHTLERISKEMNGEYLTAVDEKDLGKAFNSMIPNIYSE